MQPAKELLSLKQLLKKTLEPAIENPNIKEGNIDKHCEKDELFH